MEKDTLALALTASLTRQIEWIKMADAKANFAFAVNTAMLGLLAAVAPKTVVGWTILPLLFAAPAIVCCVISLLCVACVMFPRTWGPINSLIYFGGISKIKMDEFHDSMIGLTDDKYIEDLSNQCHRNAQIADDKFSWMQKALCWLMVACPLWALSVWLLYSGPARGA